MNKVTSPRLLLIGYLWAGPNTLFALLAALLTGSLRMSCVDGIIEVDAPRAARLLAWVLRLLSRLTGAEPIVPACFVLGHVIFSADREAMEYWRPHERVHVRQNEVWGVLWLPVYLAASAIASLRGKDPYYDNFFEAEAYAVWPGGDVGRDLVRAARRAR